jgi:preprotein translocase subunit SecD
MLKYWRILILMVTVFGAIMAIGYGPPRSGVEIMYVNSISPAAGILTQGMIISFVNAQPVSNIDDWDRLTTGLEDNVTIRTDAGEFTIDLNESTLGVDVIDVQRLNLEFGLDLRGGTRITLTPEGNATQEMVDEVVATLITRANVYGLQEINFYSVRGVDGNYFVQIEAAGVGRDVVENLLSKQGMFEAKVLKPVSITNGSGTMELGQSMFDVSYVDDDNVIVDGQEIFINDTFTLKDIDFEILNITNNQIVFLAKTYDGNDIELVKTDPQSSAIVPRGGVFQFYFVVLVSESGAQKFADVTTGIPSFVDFNTGERYLDSRIILYLDEQVVSDLQIGANLGGVVYTSPQIQGARPTLEEAIQEKLELQSILRSGALPTTLETSSIQVISPTLGNDFFQSAGFAGAAAAAMVVLIAFIKYRKIKVALPLAIIGFSEVLIILGIASVGDNAIWSGVLFVNFLIIVTAWWKKAEVDIFAWIGAFLIPLLGMASWTIDLPAIGGILAAIGTGVDLGGRRIIKKLSGKGGESKSYTMKEKVKRAFFIIFGASATTIAAMVPLMSVGIGLVRGFAITTIIGVLVGILITRPAYARIIELTAKD